MEVRLKIYLEQRNKDPKLNVIHSILEEYFSLVECCVNQLLDHEKSSDRFCVQNSQLRDFNPNH